MASERPNDADDADTVIAELMAALAFEKQENSLLNTRIAEAEASRQWLATLLDDIAANVWGRETNRHSWRDLPRAVLQLARHREERS